MEPQKRPKSYPEQGGKQAGPGVAPHFFQRNGLHSRVGVQLRRLRLVGGEDIKISPAGHIFPAHLAAQLLRFRVRMAAVFRPHPGPSGGGLQPVTHTPRRLLLKSADAKEKAVLLQNPALLRHSAQPAFHGLHIVSRARGQAMNAPDFWVASHSTKPPSLRASAKQRLSRSISSR